MIGKKTKRSATFDIKAPNFQTIEVAIRGTAPLMVHHFGEKAVNRIKSNQTSKDKVKGARPPKDYAAEFNSARYISREGWDGFYAGAIRRSMIRACSYGTGLDMTKAKGLLFVEAEGFDIKDGTPLVRIRGDKAVHDSRPGRNDDGGVDIRNRPRYDNWYAILRIRYDADHLPDPNSVLNLLARAGVSVGICEGRPGSPYSDGIGFGTFAVEGLKKAKRAAERTRKRETMRLAKDNGGAEQPRLEA